MAQRPVFMVKRAAPYFSTWSAEFKYNGGFAVSQKQKNIISVHSTFTTAHPDKKILEVSTKSLQELGVALSAFNLNKYVPSLGKSIPVENVFQGGKKFSGGGPFIDMYSVSPAQAKKDERLKNSGRLLAFSFEGKEYPLTLTPSFYDWIYIAALTENPALLEALLEYDAFTDIEFNPERSLNCQAKACAICVSLARMNKLDTINEWF